MITGKNIKQYRQLKRLTQSQLASAVGVSLPTLQRYEYGKSKPTVDILFKIADVLGVDEIDLLIDHTNTTTAQASLKALERAFEDLELKSQLKANPIIMALPDLERVENIFFNLTEEDILLLEKYADFLRSQHTEK